MDKIIVRGGKPLTALETVEQAALREAHEEAGLAEGEDHPHVTGELLQNTRLELAQNYIEDSQLNVNEIAYLLGFADQSSFQHAFRRWAGTTPGQWRRQADAPGSGLGGPG